MQRITVVLVLSIVVASSAEARQSDSMAAPTEVRLAFYIRGAVVEASTMIFFVGSFGPTLDVDFLETPLPTISHIGFRLSYQDLSFGFLRLKSERETPVGQARGVFLRGTHLSLKSRADIFAGVTYWSSSSYAEGPQFIFGADMRSYILKPWSSFFIRILGNTRGATVFLGISLGYDG